MDEAVLHPPVGGEQVMRAQLRRLVADAKRPNITIQVLPFGVGAHPETGGPFVVLAFPDPDENDLVYVEGCLGDIYLEKEREIDVFAQAFDGLVDKSMTVEQSVAFITTALLDQRE